MERVTFFENGHWCIRLNGVVYGDFPEVDRLAAYENSGLEPYDYSVMKAAMAQADEVKQQVSDVIKIIGCTDISHLKEIFQAERDGRLVAPPCKMGQTVYFCVDGKPRKGAVYNIEVFADGFVFHAENNGYYTCFSDSDIGEGVFFTPKEAEAAMKKREVSDEYLR